MKRYQISKMPWLIEDADSIFCKIDGWYVWPKIVNVSHHGMSNALLGIKGIRATVQFTAPVLAEVSYIVREGL